MKDSRRGQPLLRDRLLLWVSVALLFISLSFGTTLVFSGETTLELTREDGLFENLTAACFFGASLSFFYLYATDTAMNTLGRLRMHRNIFYLFLGLLFFIGSGEEVSWGQRMFGIKTPESWAAINMQNELNIHNLSVFHGRDAEQTRKTGWASFLTADRMFSLFWLSFCVMLPLVSRVAAPVRSILARIRLPIPPLWLGILFFLNYGTSRFLEGLLDKNLSHALVEIKESGFAVLFFLFGCFLISRSRASVALDTVSDAAKSSSSKSGI